ncbi:hypothetical protein NMG60_11015984, partial [Bertholletia excelsa]
RNADLPGDVKDQVRSFQDKLKRVSSFLNYSFDTDEPEVAALRMEIREVANNAQNTMFKLNRIKWAPGRKAKLRDLICFSGCETDLRGEAVASMERLTQKLTVIAKEDKFNPRRGLSSSGLPVEEPDAVGLDGEAEDVVHKLKQGIGKTTLARKVYNHKDVKDHFKFRAWVRVPQDYKAADLLMCLLYQISDEREDREVLDKKNQEPNEVLYKRLSKERYLIVMDDLWEKQVWDEVKSSFPDVSNGSRILLTSRLEEVALHASPATPPHKLDFLCPPDRWKLLRKTALGGESCPEELENIGVQIANKCEGLPLAIVILGRILAKQDKKVESCLPAHSKLCLLYLVLFPEGFDIPVRRLIRLWLAEGFVKWSPPMAPEDVAMEYFEYLVEKKMLQITKLRSDGSPRRCRLQDKLHGMLLPKTKDIGLFHVHDNRRHVFRRIIEYGDVKNCSVYSFSQLQNLRSYISFGPQKKDIPAREVADFVRKMTGARGYGLLRVLDLERVYKPSLPDDLGDLFHLRYLGLRWTFSESLPQSVGDLPHLETLDLKRTYINNLPNSIWKLKHLRHLNLNDIRLDMPQHSRSPMTQLLTLWGLVIDDNSRIRNGLNRLNDLRELGITFNLKDSGDLADWISNLTGLQSLRLLSKEESGRPSQLQLKSLSRLVKLSHLKLLGQLQKLPEKREFPPGLKVLTLSVSGLSDDPMPTLGQLQSLTVLRLLANSYRGKRMVCPIRGFPQLRVLKLWMLKELEEWEVKEGAMQNLKELNIRCCDKLSKLPTCLLSTLKELTLTNMPQPFVDEVRKISKHISIDNKQLDFSPLPWEEEDVFGRVQDGSQCDATTQKFHF